jgi:hypothetical protein
MTSLSAAILAVSVMLLQAPAAPRPASQPCPEPELVDLAVRRGVEFLFTQQEPDGEWFSRLDEQTYPLQLTALTTYALRTAGVPAGNLRLQRAAEKLKDRSELHAIYTRSLSLLLWCALDPEQYAARITEDAQFLVTQQHDEGAWGRGLRAGNNPDKHWQDNSNTQIALFALQQAAENGFDVPRGIWTRAEKNLIAAQNADGGWGYALRDEREIPDDLRPPYGSMTAAGLASIEVILERLYAAEELAYNGRLAAKCGQPPTKSAPLRTAADRAWQWLDEHFSATAVPGSPPTMDMDARVDEREASLAFYLHCLTRAGVGAGRRTIGDRDWSAEVLGHLVATQEEDGSWGDVQETAFALLALTSARTPVLISKLQHGDDDDWNNDPRDAAGLTQWYARKIGAPLTWDVVGFDDLRGRRAAAPVLLITGHRSPTFSDDQLAQLGHHVRSGGTILAVACCSKREFAEGVQAALAKALPELTAGPLRPEHAVWSITGPLEPREDVIGLSYGCRTPVFILTRGECCAWQQNAVAEHPSAFETAGNILRYATYLRPAPPRGADRPDPAGAPRPLRTATIARLEHAGDWSCDEQAAMANLNAELTRRLGLGVEHVAALPPAKSASRSADLLWINSHEFVMASGDAGKSRPKAILASGGTLFASACCGSQGFAASFQAWAVELVPGGEWKPIPGDDPLVTGAFHPFGAALKNPAIKQPPGQTSAVRLDSPLLYGIQYRGRWAVVFSPYDVACAISDHPCYGCVGYERNEALALMGNVLLHAGGGKPTRGGEPKGN